MCEMAASMLSTISGTVSVLVCKRRKVFRERCCFLKAAGVTAVRLPLKKKNHISQFHWENPLKHKTEFLESGKNLKPNSVLADSRVTWLISLPGLLVQFRTLRHARHMDMGFLSLLLRTQNTCYRVPSLLNAFWIFAGAWYLMKVESSSQLYMLI